MRIRLLTFASASDAVGTSELELELPSGSTLAELKLDLERRYPSLRGLWGRLAVAIDGELVAGDAPLAEGAEVALLPPVSGGAGSAGRLALVDEPIDVEALVKSVEGPERGAVVLFLGNVRNHHRGRTVERITYSAYRSMAESRLRGIVERLEADHVDLRVGLVHRLGSLELGETSVAIAVASPHREAAYAVSRQALERLKTEVPIWKQEHYRDGDVAWREEERLGWRGTNEPARSSVASGLPRAERRQAR